MFLDVANIADKKGRFEGVIFLLRTVDIQLAERFWDLTHVQTLLPLDGRNLQSFCTVILSSKCASG